MGGRTEIRCNSINLLTCFLTGGVEDKCSAWAPRSMSGVWAQVEENLSRRLVPVQDIQHPGGYAVISLQGHPSVAGVLIDEETGNVSIGYFQIDLKIVTLKHLFVALFWFYYSPTKDCLYRESIM